MTDAINGLLGRSLKHSFSVPIHHQLGNLAYRLYEREPEQLEAFLTGNHIELLNVTIPYKKTVLPYCNTLSEEAQAIGSANTIVSTTDGLYGCNTDVYGFTYLATRAGIGFAGKKVLIFGSGGASASAEYAARTSGARSVVVVSRSGENHYGTLSSHADAEIVVNATPVGMYPSEIGNSVVDLALFPRCEAVLDLVYNPLRTALIMQVEKRGIVSAGGLAMLVAQAVAAEELFMSHETPDSETERILRLILAEQENIILIGMPGSGKTSIGKELAKLTGRELIDLDEKIVQVAGMTIPEIFAQSGEEAFRILETEQAKLYGKEHGLIITTGGGIITEKRNYAHLRQNGRLYHIVRDTAQLAREGRPLSLNADLEELYEERLPQYLRFRDVEIENTGKPKEAAEIIWREFNVYTHS